MARPVDLEADGSVIWESEGRTIDPDLVPGERYTESRPPTADELDDILDHAYRHGESVERLDYLRTLGGTAVRAGRR